MNVYLLDLASVTEQDISDYTHVLDADRQIRIAQYGRSADKRRSFGVGMALLYAWRMQYQNRAMPRTARDENGKPYFVGETISFGLSHSGKYAACVLAENPKIELGLDIQEPRSVRASAAARFFSKGEREQLCAGDDPCLIWSRKESLAKYRGSGLRGDLRLLDTADNALCRQPLRIEDNAISRRQEQTEDNAISRRQEQTEDNAISRRQKQTAGTTAYLWTCQTFDGYAVSVCMGEDTACRLEYLTWERVKELVNA